MADNVAVAESVVTAPVTTVTDTTSVVTPAAAPEVDLLTRVSQFKAPVVEDKILNPPEQPEFAKITDPVAREAAKEAVERMRRGMQSDYTKKVEDAQRLVNQSKSWTPQRIQQELLTNPEFLQAAQMIQGTQAPQERQLTQEEYSALTDKEKAELNAIPQLKNELQQMKNQNLHEQLMVSINQKDLTLRSKFTDYDPQKINEAAQRFGKLTPADAREYIYKADNYEISVKNAYEMGKLEGQGKLQTKINTITPQGSTITSNENVPTKAAGENDKAFFVRLGQFRLAQYKNQK
jgi:hypothetical protein